MKSTFQRLSFCQFAVVVLLAVFLTGCGSTRFGNYTAPEVRGRVLAADARLPLAGVEVSRVSPEQSRQSALPEKGVQSLEQTWTVKTDADGWFIYPSQSYLLVFHRSGGWSLNLSLQAHGYVSVQTNLTSAKATGSLPDGKPLVDMGEILLQPKSR
jgi:prolipoprotein diacylglyceryltransferase